ncbi:TRAP transporter small permease [Rhizobium halophytocola]|uniref:TRAP transporter small permease protein n=1 Tax=Rhizobium halophytocola TaxID=735519 RepID=A0ABS4DV74_9HYPH|nr:TRAP transporter small permease [Rhizobium halophytocola]MBP1849599.1 TRAP-type C4-dicarboxylate transport system permease small subunit [Rhizobium halophytocola]
MKFLFDLTGRLSQALAALAKLLIGAMILIVIADVVIRNLDLKPISWGVSVSEYILLYVTFLPMPWLVHNKGHVFVEFLRNLLPPGGRAVLEKVVYLVCVALCLVLGFIAVTSLIGTAASGEYETRSFDMPKWAVFLPMAIGFFVSAIEWLRYLMGHASLYDLDPLEMEGL